MFKGFLLGGLSNAEFFDGVDGGIGVAMGGGLVEQGGFGLLVVNREGLDLVLEGLEQWVVFWADGFVTHLIEGVGS